MSNYISSIVFKYGDTDNVARDAKTLNEILNRQGTSLLLDVVAEHVGHCANKFRFPNEETARLKANLLKHLNDAIDERT